LEQNVETASFVAARALRHGTEIQSMMMRSSSAAVVRTRVDPAPFHPRLPTVTSPNSFQKEQEQIKTYNNSARDISDPVPQQQQSPTNNQCNSDTVSSTAAPNWKSEQAKEIQINGQQQQQQQSHIPQGRAVPSTRMGRALGFAGLGLGLVWGTAVEGISRVVASTASSDPIVLNDKNSDRLAQSLRRMRGAALKMGQMLSIQDESLLPGPLTRALAQVRQNAEAMPTHQLIQQLEHNFGTDWRSKFVSFDMNPVAAASIGQVHRATIIDKRRQNKSIYTNTNASPVQHVVVKVQYPGVAQSIESDLRNLSMLVQFSGLAPPGLFIENVIRVGRNELKVECDYLREKHNQLRLRSLVHADPVLQRHRFVVPDVMDELTTDQILTTEYVPGGTIDKAIDMDQTERNRIGRTILYLTMKELFEWRFMQTDPNWGNFLYDVNTKTVGLIDFGATREYSKSFVDGYLRIVWASANRDETTLMEISRAMGFLTGDENAEMIRAHQLSAYTVGEPFFASREPFDFRGSNISARMGEHTSVFLRHRLTPPPEEVYTLHRKLAGAYMLCIKLGAIVQCRDMLEDIVRTHTFDDGLENPLPSIAQRLEPTTNECQ
jgi:aarF domain-containing kinase